MNTIELKAAFIVPSEYKQGKNILTYPNFTPRQFLTCTEWKSVPLHIQVLYEYTPVNSTHPLKV